MTSNFSRSSSNADQKCEYIFKVVVIGELATGKTAVVKRYVHNLFSEYYRSTVGVDFALKILKYDNDTVIRLQLWDVAGQERFGSMTRVYYKDAVGCLVVYDVTRESTFDGITKWKTDLDNKVQLPDGNPVPCVLLANKCDLVKGGLVNNAEKINKYCRENGFSKWFQTSAKDNTNIESSIQFLIEEIMQRITNSSERPSNDLPIQLGTTQPRPNNGGNCCG